MHMHTLTHATVADDSYLGLVTKQSQGTITKTFFPEQETPEFLEAIKRNLRMGTYRVESLSKPLKSQLSGFRLILTTANYKL